MLQGKAVSPEAPSGDYNNHFTRSGGYYSSHLKNKVVILQSLLLAKWSVYTLQGRAVFSGQNKTTTASLQALVTIMFEFGEF